MKNDHRSKFSNLSNWKEKAWKIKASTGFEPVTDIPVRCSTNWAMTPYIGSEINSSLWSTTAVQMYELFHIYFKSFQSSRENERNKLTSLPMYGFIAQLVERRTGIAEVTGLNPVEALIFFRLLLSNCLNWKIYCDDHSSPWSTTAVQMY